ncbi:MAG: hypothetical protein IID46_03285 [Planctomycetes bacterium]|nr:hypothetical protein [Planctomycetota bacterium]
MSERRCGLCCQQIIDLFLLFIGWRKYPSRAFFGILVLIGERERYLYQPAYAGRSPELF